MSRFLFVPFFSLLVFNYIGAIPEDANPNNNNNNNNAGQDDTPKLNVVLFFAKTPPGQTVTDSKGLKCLKFEEKARVKHCTNNNEQTDSLSELMSAGSDCKQLLKAGFFSLISYARNVRGMTTALASLENDTFTNGLRFRKSETEDFEIFYPIEKKRHTRGIPFYRNAFPAGLSRRMRLRNGAGKRLGGSDIITDPEHSEVFHIRAKRQAFNEQNDMLDQKCNKNEEGGTINKPKWDVMGVMANIKLTFFGKLFENDKESTETGNKNDETSQIGQVQENSFFDLVKTTLANVQESCSHNGFLIIFIGGCLMEVADPHSPLVQSVKHVVENTDEKNTMILVTGSCPNATEAGGGETPPQEQGVESEASGAGAENKTNNLIPVYVKGARCNDMRECQSLPDIPYFIKNILADMSVGGDYFASVKVKRRRKRQAASCGPPIFYHNILLLFILSAIFF